MAGRALGLHLRGPEHGVKETPAHRKLWTAQGGGPWLLYHSAVSSLHGSALWEAGKAAEPPRLRSCPGRESWSGEMGWDGKHE